MTSEDKTAPKKAPAIDPDSMSADDQLAVQQLHTARDAAEARGDEQAVKDIDARLTELTTPKQ